MTNSELTLAIHNGCFKNCSLNTTPLTEAGYLEAVEETIYGPNLREAENWWRAMAVALANEVEKLIRSKHYDT